MPDPLSYEEVTDDLYADRFVSSLAPPTPTRRGVLLSGTCPRCAHAMDFPVVTEVFRSSAGAGVAATDETSLLCTCTTTHPDRPAGEEGCGAYWNIRLTRSTS